MGKEKQVIMLKIVLILGCLASWWLSYRLSTALCSTTEEKIVASMIVTVMQAFMLWFYVHKRYTMAFILLAISIMGNVTFWYNQNSEQMQDKLKNSSVVAEQQNINDTKIKFLDIGTSTKEEVEKDFDKQIDDKKAELTALEQSIVTTKQDTEAQIKEYNKKKGVGAWYKGENEKAQRATLKKNIENINSKIEKIHQDIDTLNSQKRDDVKSLVTQIKESTQIQQIDYSKATKEVIYTQGYLGIMSKFGNWIGVEANTLVLIFLMIFGISFEVALIYGHLLIQELEGKKEKVSFIKKPVQEEPKKKVNLSNLRLVSNSKK